VTVVAMFTDIITVDFVVNMATKFTDVMVVSIVTGVHCLQCFTMLTFFIFKSEHDKFVHCYLLWLHTGCAEILLSGYKFEITCYRIVCSY
jgi:hypothetical protein